MKYFRCLFFSFVTLALLVGCQQKPEQPKAEMEKPYPPREQNVDACETSLTTIGEALNKYADENNASFPPTDGDGVEVLIPKYLDKIPGCPAGGVYSYEVGLGIDMNVIQVPNYYYLRCTGDAHKDAGLQDGFPAYDVSWGGIRNQQQYDQLKAKLAESKDTKPTPAQK
jgi:hypothetical protein